MPFYRLQVAFLVPLGIYLVERWHKFLDQFELNLLADGIISKLVGFPYVFASTHLHHRNQKVCHLEQIRAVLDALAPYIRRGMTVFLTGDFNSSPAGIAPRETAKVLRDAYLVSETKPVQPEPCTFHGFAPVVSISPARKRKPRIDFIWVTPDVRVLRYESVNNFDGKKLASSDHYPQLAEVEF